MKKQSFQMKQWAKVCLALSLGLPLTACVDDSYDASKDIDMTMGLGSQGLQLKLGNTENIMLADLLEEDENLKTDAQHTYYLIESGRTNVNFSVDRMNAYIDNAVLSPALEVLNYSKLQELIPAAAGSLNVPEGFVYQINNLTADNSMNFKFDNISSVVKQVKSITPAAGTKLKTRVRDNILKSKEQKNIQPTKGGHKMVTCQNYVSLFYRQITSCPSDGGIS